MVRTMIGFKNYKLILECTSGPREFAAWRTDPLGDGRTKQTGGSPEHTQKRRENIFLQWQELPIESDWLGPVMWPL